MAEVGVTIMEGFTAALFKVLNNENITDMVTVICQVFQTILW